MLGEESRAEGRGTGRPAPSPDVGSRDLRERCAGYSQLISTHSTAVLELYTASGSPDHNPDPPPEQRQPLTRHTEVYDRYS